MRKPISAHDQLSLCFGFGFASLTNAGNQSLPKLVEPQEGGAPLKEIGALHEAKPSRS